MAPHHSPRRSPRRLLLAAIAAAVVCLGLLPGTPTAAAAPPIEDYASYEPQERCARLAQPGMVHVSRWMVKRFGGVAGGITRACGGSVSEHQEGRAFDWMLDADRLDDRARAQRFLETVLATDKRGNPHALARRMGVMYVIWDDRMYAAYDRFEPRRYRHSACRNLRTCSQTLRHRDHLHLSLTRKGGRGRTSWFVRQAARQGR